MGKHIFANYELTTQAMQALARAETTEQASDVFDSLAPHVPEYHRAEVWVLVPAALGLNAKQLQPRG